MKDDRADAFLRLIRLSERGRLKVYLGYSAGVGKTYQMLQEGRRLRADGIDVVIGLLEPHGRADIIRLARGLETVPRKRREYHGIALEEMDAEAVIARRPRVALVDELAHTNVPGSRNAKRFEDVQDILSAGIHVITTLNVQHLESLYNIVESSVGVKVRERLPDAVLAEADQIVDVDLATEDLRRRLEEGKIYPAERVGTALTNFFRPENLDKLRELTLRELAAQIDLRRRETQESGPEAAADQVMVCLSSHGPNSDRLLRYGSRLAGKLNRNWYAVYVQTPSEEATVIDAGIQRGLSDTLTLAKQLGAMVFTYKGEDIADTILRFAGEYRVGHIVLGKSRPRPWWKRLGRNKDVAETVIRNARGASVIVLDTGTGPPLEPRTEMGALPANGQDEPRERPERDGPGFPALSRWVSRGLIRIWDEPVVKEEVLAGLAAAAARETRIGADLILGGLRAREARGSTFFNEGVAFPHVRVNELEKPVIALGITRKGIPDVATKKPIEVVFLILSPARDPDVQVRLLAVASRAAQRRDFIRMLGSADGPAEVLAAIQGRGPGDGAAGTGSPIEPGAAGG